MSLMMKTLIVLLVIGIGSFIVVFNRPRVPDTPDSIYAVEASIEKMISNNQPPGISVVVIKDGQIVYDAAFGMADTPNRITASKETTYHWWSLTKITTAIAVLQLQDAGFLSIDDPVRMYLDDFEVTLDGEPAPPITIRQLLRHSSGLADPMPAMIGWVHFEDEIYNQTELLRQHLPSYSQLKYEPDSQSAYSNLGYMVLGAIIEKVSGQPYEEYVQSNILSPLGMGDTGFLYTPDATQHMAAGSHPLASIYTPLLPFLLDFNALVSHRTGGIFWFNPVYTDVTPSSGLIGTAGDAALLAQALLDEKEILTSSGHSLLRPRGEAVNEMPLGWAEYSTGDRLWVQHRGGGPGFASIMRLYPEEGLGIVVMANSTNLPANELAAAFATIDWDTKLSKGDTP